MNDYPESHTMFEYELDRIKEEIDNNSYKDKKTVSKEIKQLISGLSNCDEEEEVKRLTKAAEKLLDRIS